MADPIAASGGPGWAQSFGRKEDTLRSASGSPEGRTQPEAGPELARACRDLESLFLTYLLKEMRETIPKNGLLSGGKAEEICTSLADAELAKELAAGGGIGISQVLLAQVSRTWNTAKDEGAPETGK